jgi:uncharacterized protein YdhG (YjbR/CyaY superfamily)
MAAAETVDEYLATLPEDRRAVLQQLRRLVTAAAPDAEEAIAYGMPALRSQGRFLLSYDAYKSHYSLFPASDAVVEGLGDAVRPYLAGRGTIRFPAAKPIPEDLVTRIVGILVAEHSRRPRTRH